MQLKGTKTEANLKTAFIGESIAKIKYTIFSDIAKKEGYENISTIFDNTAKQEKEHARIWLEYLEGYGGTLENLKTAVEQETQESKVFYGDFAKTARKEGFEKIAYLFEQIGKIEQKHDEQYKLLIQNLEKKSLFEKQTQQQWECKHCGYGYNSKKAEVVCPVCEASQSWQEIVKKPN